MRIAIWHNLPSGGGKRALYHQVQGLLARGHHVEVWCPPQADLPYLPLSALVPQHVVTCAPFSAPGHRRQRRRGHPLGPVLAYSLASIEAMDEHCRQCAAEMAQGGFDVLFANPCMHLRASSIGRRTNLPAMLYLPEPFRKLYEANPSLPWVDASGGHTAGRLRGLLDDYRALAGLRRLAREERANAGAYQLLVTNSQYSRESILRAYGLESEVDYLGIDTDLFKPNGAPREPFVVGLGSLHPDKGVDRAIRAVAAIDASRRPDLVWVGNFADVQYGQRMEKLARSLAVTFRPQINVSDAEVVDWLCRASVMLFTSFLEPFGLAPLEASACETPVVAIAEGGVRESMRDGLTGTLVSDAEPSALGTAIARYLDNPALARETGRQARRYVMDHWTWEASLNRLEQQLNRVAAQAPQT